MSKIASKVLKRAEKQADVIQRFKAAAANLTQSSEALRQYLDAVDGYVRLYEVECDGLVKIELSYVKERLDSIREKRNAMECFALQCRINELMEKAWEALP